MATKNIALAYCIDNLHLAEAIERALSATSYSFSHYYCKKSQTDAPLTDQLRDHNGPILLLISDNFLKSIHCMNRALQLIQQKTDDILPVVIDGMKKDDATGEMVQVPTRFEKIGDIIPYINYWQNQYLDLRSQRKRIETENDFDKEAFGDHLRVLRQVSSEASEFLRVLRNMHYLQFQELTADHFAALFNFLEDDEEWEAFKIKAPEVTVEVQQPESAPEEVAPATEEETADLPPLEIPGIELLEGRDNVAKIINRKMDQAAPPTDETEQPTEPEVPEPVLETNDLQEEDFKGEPAETNDRSNTAHAEEDSLLPEEFPSEKRELEPDPEFHEVNQLFDDSLLEEEIEEEEEAMEEEEPELSTEEEDLEEDDEPGDLFPDHSDETEKVRELIQQANALIRADQIEDGLTYMTQATKKFPDNTDLRYHFALILAQHTSDLSTAIHQLDTLLEIDPLHTEGNYLMGELSELKGAYERAQMHYTRVAEQDENYPEVFYRLGVVVSHLYPNSKEKAAKYFKKAAKKNPQHVDAHYQYALLLHEKLDKPKKAVKYFKHTLKLEPHHPFANYDLALVYYNAGNRKRAAEYYQKAIVVNPELQTEENDIAFKYEEPVLSTPELTTPPPEVTSAVQDTPPVANLTDTLSSTEHDTIEALKMNIKKLEELLTQKVAVKPEPEEPLRPKVDKTVFITGASSGIGRATARIFAENGYRLIINGRRAERLQELEKEFREEFGGDVLALPFDVSDINAVYKAIDELPEAWKRVDILINNAGKAKGLAPIHEGRMDHWEEMINVNIKGLLYLTRAISPFMVARQSGHIINISSTAGKEVYPNGNVYCATKHAVEALTKSMRIDLHKHNIRVSQIAPGMVEETEFALVRFDGDAEKAKIYEDFNPVTSRDVAEAIYFVATRPPHVNIQDVLLMGTQQANSNIVDRSGRKYEEEEE